MYPHRQSYSIIHSPAISKRLDTDVSGLTKK